VNSNYRTTSFRTTMKRSKKSANPFYAVLLVAGLTFVVTAAAYGVMATRESRAAVSGEPVAEHVLMEWMHDHGDAALLGELAILGTAVFAAIGTDNYWQRRAARKE
jgi:cytochrome b